MEDFLANNLTALAHTWPQLAREISRAPDPATVTLDTTCPEPTLVVNSLHLSSGYDRRAEARIQASQIGKDADYAWVYGLGTGILPEILLQRPQLKQLTVVLFNPSVVRAVCRAFDLRTWLTDPRVELRSAAGEDSVFFPFAAVPPCLLLADTSSARLRDLVFLEISTPYIHKKHSEQKSLLQQRIRDNLPLVRKDGDVAALYGTLAGKTVVVTGAGPSLADQYDWLHAHRQEVVIVATDASLIPLFEAGITVDYAVCIDSHPTRILPFFQTDHLSMCSQATLIYFPVVHPDVLNLWPGQRVTAYSRDPLYDEIRAMIHKGNLFASGSVIHPAVDFAVKAGAAEIIFAGADFGFPGDRSHVRGSRAKKFAMGKKRHWLLDGNGGKLPTSPSLRGFLRDLESYIALHPAIRFYNAGRRGAAIQGTELLEQTGA